MIKFLRPRPVMAFQWDGTDFDGLKKFLGEDFDEGYGIMAQPLFPDRVNFRVWLDGSRDGVGYYSLCKGEWLVNDGIAFRRVSDQRLSRAYQELTKDEILTELVQEAQEMGGYDG